ncbi:hypothetical protein [Paraglaciecola sp. L3A3]|uniref:hypothetical protein n=1 Tax=Paraglaciecola sp. L3A3 TaxID=2686358 RepID=UPI00131CE166|nr:hypothetical protein [Paraglaciecola sp. L3A3]
MYKKIFAVVILCFFSSVVFAKQAPKSLFTCLDLENYSVDASCSSALIAENKNLVTLQQELSVKMEQQNPNVMATVQFHPEKMLIKVIAQKQLAKKTKLLAAL